MPLGEVGPEKRGGPAPPRGAGPVEPQLLLRTCPGRCPAGAWAFAVPAEVHSIQVCPRATLHNVGVLRVSVALAFSAATLASVTFPHGEAVIRTSSRTVTVRVELARTAEQQAVGLQGRRSLPRNAGMAFLFSEQTHGSFWMKNTSIPLSIAFWGRRGRILRILDMAPCRSDPCPRYDPRVGYWGALEVNRGAFRRWGVRLGDLVRIRR